MTAERSTLRTLRVLFHHLEVYWFRNETLLKDGTN
jgi:hypothetical protein